MGFVGSGDVSEVSGGVIWITGMSAAGKTTLGAAVRSRLRRDGVCCVCLDGDMVREAMGGDLGYAEADRMVQIRRIQTLSRHLSAQGLVVIVAALYSHPDLLRWNRTAFPRYVEVYLQASLEALKRRDPKGVYGRPADVVGVHIPWRPPVDADVRFDTDTLQAPEGMADRVVQAMTAKWSGARPPSSHVAGAGRND
jgi:adenylylsulfate kinase-like enzyme